MITGRELLKQRFNLDVDKESIPVEKIEEHISAVVKCTGCEMTMWITSDNCVIVNEYFWCRTCAPDEEKAEAT